MLVLYTCIICILDIQQLMTIAKVVIERATLSIETLQLIDNIVSFQGKNLLMTKDQDSQFNLNKHISDNEAHSV